MATSILVQLIQRECLLNLYVQVLQFSMKHHFFLTNLPLRTKLEENFTSKEFEEDVSTTAWAVLRNHVNKTKVISCKTKWWKSMIPMQLLFF